MGLTPRKKEVSKIDVPEFGKGLTAEARQNQLIALAYDLVEQRLRDGTATSQETTHFLKMGTAKARLEERLMEADCKLREAKTEAIERDKRIEELYNDAIKMVQRYRGYSDIAYEEDIE